MPEDLSAIEDLLGEDSYRTRGIRSWELASQLGIANLARLESLVDKFIYHSMAQGEEPDELKALARGKRALARLREQSSQSKPYLPRLRNELFNAGDTLMLYLGDTPSYRGSPWREVNVERVEKGHNSAWIMDSSQRGYYWRVTVRDKGRPLLPDQNTLSFSTTEPRAILRTEFDYLLEAREHDPLFFQMFCDNAYREWEPIWCIESGLTCQTDMMDMARWLEEAS